MAELKSVLGRGDRLWVFGLGHANLDDGHAFLHLPGPDLRDDEFAALFRGSDGRGAGLLDDHGRLGLVPHAALDARAGSWSPRPSATGEVNETEFPHALAEVAALADRERLDPDTDGKVSVRELFDATVGRVEARFAADKRRPDRARPARRRRRRRRDRAEPDARSRQARRRARLEDLLCRPPAPRPPRSPRPERPWNGPRRPAADDRDEAAVARLREARARLKAEIARVVVGQDQVLDELLMALLCRGHVLMLGVPGPGQDPDGQDGRPDACEMDFNRIQFTPDLMPSDIIGTDIVEEDPETGRRRLDFFQGPLFTQFLLADEINRAPPKTQSALLQAMQEREVSVGRRTYKLEPPFFVVATQNPIEQEGTYPLPEAQLDRFMFNIPVIYPTPDEEVAIVKGTTANVAAEVRPVLEVEEILRLQELVRGVPVADSVVRYAVNLVGASRPSPGEGPDRATRSRSS